MRDVWSDAGHEQADDSGACTLTDDEKLRLEEEQCQQLQQENDFLQAQLAEASSLKSRPHTWNYDL